MHDDGSNEFDTEYPTVITDARAPRAVESTAVVAAYWAEIWTAKNGTSEKSVDATDDAR
jgi:hypothetical protein